MDAAYPPYSDRIGSAAVVICSDKTSVDIGKYDLVEQAALKAAEKSVHEAIQYNAYDYVFVLELETHSSYNINPT